MNKAELKKEFEAVTEKNDMLYDFIVLFYERINLPHDYGTGELISMVEVHTLGMVDDNPGITVSEIAKRRGRTLGAASQMISKLVKKELVYKEKEKGNAKTVHLYVTEKGKALSTTHRLYDVEEMDSSLQMMLQSCTLEEMNAFVKVALAYREYFMNLNETPST